MTAGLPPDGQPTIARLIEMLNAVRSVNEAMGTYNPTALAALHWGEQAVQEIARLSAEVVRLEDALTRAENEVWSLTR